MTERRFRFLFVLAIIILIAGGFLVYQKIKRTGELPPDLPMFNLNNKKIAMVVAFRDFRDEEYFTPRSIFEGLGAEVKTFSDKEGTAIGADGGDIEGVTLVDNLNPADFDAVVFIGGPGALNHLDNEKSYRVVRETVQNNKVLAAICVSPVILAKAGVLEGKKATVWSSVMDKGTVKILRDNKAIYQDEAAMVDGKIVTGNGPAAAKQFGETVAGLLTQ